MLPTQLERDSMISLDERAMLAFRGPMLDPISTLEIQEYVEVQTKLSTRLLLFYFLTDADRR